MKPPTHWGRADNPRCIHSPCRNALWQPCRHIALEYAQNVLTAYSLNASTSEYVLSALGKATTAEFYEILRHNTTAPDVDTIRPPPAHGRTNDEITPDDAIFLLQSDACTLTCKEAVAHLKALTEREIKLSCESATEFNKRLKTISELFRLSGNDVTLLVYALVYTAVHPFHSLAFSIMPNDIWDFTSISTGLRMRDILDCWSNKGRLRRCGLLENASIQGTNWPMQLDEDICDYLLGIKLDPSASFATQYFETISEAHYEPDSFGLPKESLALFKCIINSNQPCNILLYGKPGTGKTELTKGVVAHCGKKACFVRHGDGKRNTAGRRTALEATTNLAERNDAVVVVDEADSLLNTRYAFLGVSDKDSIEKGWLNDFLDRNQSQIIWITNDIDSIEESTRRRFSYSIRFGSSSIRQQETIWREHLKDHPLREAIGDPMIRSFSREYSVGPAGIANTLQAMRHLGPDISRTPTEVEEAARHLLESHQQLTGNTRGRGLIPALSQYDLDAVNTDTPPSVIITGLRQIPVQQARRTQHPVNVLFWGAPGTGKTAFAQYLASETGRELLVKRASDLLSMYVGGTEANISAAFEEAECENAILFLDEADSFFIRRDTALRSWETSQTNELLTQMENHHGVLICCTNLRTHLDHAAMRRFTWKVQFLPLTREGKIRLYRKYFETPDQPLPDALIPRIAAIPELTPGDIKAVWLQYRHQDAGSWHHEDIVLALESEVGYKQGRTTRIGFTENE